MSISRTTTKRIVERKGVLLNLQQIKLERREKTERCYRKGNYLNTIIAIKKHAVEELFIVFVTLSFFFFFFLLWVKKTMMSFYKLLFDSIDGIFEFLEPFWNFSSSGLISLCNLLYLNYSTWVEGRFSTLFTTTSYVVLAPDECWVLLKFHS